MILFIDSGGWIPNLGRRMDYCSDDYLAPSSMLSCLLIEQGEEKNDELKV
jgi:hypothetical protein